MFESVNWHQVFSPSMPVLEIVVRGSFVYLSIFLLLRIVLKRQSGNLGVTDLLVIVLIADAAQNAMAGEYKSIPDGLILVSTIVFWSYALDWLSYYVPGFGRLIHPSALELIKDGKVNRKHLRQELITMEELKEQLREQGIEDVKDVHRACMEGDGRISVVKKDEDQHQRPKGASA
jgi:uncharacterized membrane protein YcaP (DUF421 family)